MKIRIGNIRKIGFRNYEVWYSKTKAIHIKGKKNAKRISEIFIEITFNKQ